jgi:toxin YoeB
MRLLWEERAWDDYCYWQTQDKKMLKRIKVSESRNRCGETSAVGGADVLMKRIESFIVRKTGLL